MPTKFTELLNRPVIKLVVVEAIILGVMVLLSIILGFTYSTGLILVGAAILVLRFTGGSSTPNISKAAFSYELQKQYVRDVKDINQTRRRIDLMSDLLIIGIIPLAIGIFLSLARF